MTKRALPAATRQMPIERRDTQQAEFIRSEAVKLFAEHGYAAATMDLLCERVQLNKGTVYYYYKSKASILFHIAETTISGALNSLLSADHFDSASHTLRSIVKSYMTWLFANTPAARVLAQEIGYLHQILSQEQLKSLNEKQRLFLREIRSVLERGLDNGEFRSHSPEIVGRALVVLCNSVINWPVKKFNRDVVADTLIELFMKGHEAD